MALDPIRPKDLPAAPTVFITDAIPVDNGSAVQRATPVQIVNVVAPVASQAEAIAGLDAIKRMTPLTTKQVLDNAVAPSVLRAQAWAESATAPDPLDSTSKSAKTWAGLSGVSATSAASSALSIAPYASYAAAAAATVPAPVSRISAIVNGAIVDYVRDAAGTALTTVGGQKWSPDLGKPVMLGHWGVIPSTTYAAAVTDYTTEVQAAALWTNGTLNFTGWVKISDKIVANARCRVHCPAGHDQGGFVCRSDFNLTATSVFQPGATGVEGSPIGDIGFWFDHTAATASGLRADLVQYPWAIGLSSPNITRMTFDRIRIMGAWNGLNVQGNAGGLKGTVLEISAFNEVCNINGVLDFCHIENIHIWPFAVLGTPTLVALYYDGTASFNLGDCDGLHIGNLSSFRVKVTCTKADNILPATIGTLKMDGEGARWIHTSGLVNVAQLYSTKSTTATLSSIVVNGGDLYVTTGVISGAETVPQVLVAGGSFTMLGGEVFQNSTDRPSLRVTSGTMSLSDVMLRWAGTRTQPLIEQSSTGVLRIDNLRPIRRDPAQTLVTIGTDVVGNSVDFRSMTAHVLLLPAITGPLLGRYITEGSITILGSADNYPIGVAVTSGSTTETAAVANNLPALAGTGTAARWWEVETAGIGGRLVQRATEILGTSTTRCRSFTRVKQDSTWYAWRETTIV